jgi:hypothetical protein
MQSTASLLRLAEFLVYVAVNGAVLSWSIEAYRRTKWRGFAVWICSHTMGILLMTVWFGVSEWYRRGGAHSLPPSLWSIYSACYRVCFIVLVIVAGIGSVLVIRQVLGEIAPINPVQPTAGRDAASGG